MSTMDGNKLRLLASAFEALPKLESKEVGGTCQPKKKLVVIGIIDVVESDKLEN